MTVYLVWHERDYNNDLIGIFSSIEKAQDHRNKYTPYDQMSIIIEEEEVE